MSQYNKTVLTHAGLELAKRANAGQAKFGITRAVTSADDWSHKTVQDLEEVTTIPNIMQQGTIMDADKVESNNSVIGVSLCFTNKNLSTGYQIRIIGLYVKEEGQENDFLYAVTTAITPEYMPSFADKVLYRFNTQMYLVIGNAQSVNVVINEGTAVTRTQFDKYKVEVTENLKELENTHKEDMSHVAKSASVNGGAEILPDSTGKLNLVVPDPDLSKYVSLEQLGELLKAKANAADVNKQIKAVTDLANTKANTVDVDSKIKTVTDLANTKANSADVYTKTETDSRIDEAKNTVQSNLDSVKKDLNTTINTKANSDDVYNRSTVDNAFTEVRGRLSKLEGTQTLDSPDFNGITASGVYYITNNNGANIKNNPVDQWGVLIVSNGDGHRVSQVYYPDDGNPPWYRSLDESTWRSWYQLSTRNDVNNATNLANAASNKVDTVLTNSYVHKQGMNQNGDLVEIKHAGVKQDNGGYAFDMWSDDWTAEKVHEVLGQLPNKANLSDVSALQSKVNTSNNLFNHMLDNSTWQGITGISNTNNAVLTSIRDDTYGGNTVGGNGAGIAFGGGDTKAVLSVGWQTAHAIITGGNGNAPVWHEEVAWKSDIDRLQSIINQQNQTIQSLTTRLTNAENEIRYIKDNYIEGRTFPASQEAQAEAWENEKPTRLAMIEK